MLKEQPKVQRLMYSNIYDDITDFKVCGFTKTQTSKYVKCETYKRLWYDEK